MRHIQTRPSLGRNQTTVYNWPSTSEQSARQISPRMLQPGCSEIPEYLFRLARAALRDGYSANTARHLHDAAAYLSAAARQAPDAARQAVLRKVAAEVRLAAGYARSRTLSDDGFTALCARAQLALADCEQRDALLAWLRSDYRRAGCHLDSAIRQLRRARAWIARADVAPEAEEEPASDAQRIADALAEGWCVRSDRVSALLFGLEAEIALMSRALRPTPPPA